MLPLFGTTIFLGAVLVFGVQPIAARMLLPSFGGSPAVWSATSVFFQLALLAGYAYSFALTNRATPRRQPLVHLVALAAPLVFLPLSLRAATSPGGLPPAIAVIALLTLTVGVPFVVAATTGPLLQRWFSYTGHRAGRDPYFLYAASNAGSLLVLLAYPFVIEPRFTLAEQSSLWSGGYVAFAALSAASAAVVMRRAPAVANADAEPAAADLEARVDWRMRGWWVLLAAVPSALSLGATAYISTDIAAVPLLWIAPLSLYLLSFIVAFSNRLRVRSGIVGQLLVWVAAAMVIPSGGLLELPVWTVIGLHLAFLFVAATMCHTRLAESRPAPTRLTEYYLLIAIGGALGGIFVSLMAPAIFDAVWEYPIAIGLALLLRPRALRRPTKRVVMAGAIVLVVLILVAGLGARGDVPIPTIVTTLAIGLALLVLLLGASTVRPALAAIVFAILGISVWGGGEAMFTDRTFFGVYRVTTGAGAHNLVHGTTLHGMQHFDAARRYVATTYFHRTGPIGQVFEARGFELERVAVVGLGIGTLATYGQPHQQFTFFEIDPAMVAIAQDQSLFTFLADTKASVAVVVADGRLGIEAASDRYDLLIIDAFSSDAIPVHLLTREAIAAYTERLSATGMIAMNISNRYLELEPVVASIAHSLGMTVLAQHDLDVNAADAAEGKSPSRWVILAREPEDLRPFIDDARWVAGVYDPTQHPWTDDFSDILGALR